MKLPHLILGWIFLLASLSASSSCATASGSNSDDEGGSGSSVDDDKDDVVMLTSIDFEKRIGDGSIWLVEFYAPWCKSSTCWAFEDTVQSRGRSFHFSFCKDVNKKIPLLTVCLLYCI